MNKLELMDIVVVLRPMETSDEHFIYATWLRSFRHSNLVRNVSDTIYYKMHHKLIELALNNGATLVACLQDSPSVIIGWCNFSEESLNYVYVKNNFRRFGIARLLMGSVTDKKYYTHSTESSKHVTKGLNYNPYLI